MTPTPGGQRGVFVGALALAALLAGASSVRSAGLPTVLSAPVTAGSSPAVEEQVEQPDGAAAPAVPGPASSSPTVAGSGAAARVESAPMRVRIRQLGVDASLMRLGLNPDGTLEVPVGGRRAGWFTGGARPGQTGAAVIAGHVSTKQGRAVFARLGELRRGAAVDVARTDGSVLTFVVDRVERHPKDRFPTEEVYGPTEVPTLRLITCGGLLDRRTGSFTDNVVVFATLRAPLPAPAGTMSAPSRDLEEYPA